MSFSYLISLIAEGQVFVTDQVDGTVCLYFENGSSVSMSKSEVKEALDELGYLQDLLAEIEALNDPYQE